MSKNYCSLGLMSGTSGDGVDASLINSDGDSSYKIEINKYFEYENNLSQKYTYSKTKLILLMILRHIQLSLKLWKKN